MTDNNHPITPPDELVEQWHDDALGSDPSKTVAEVIATQAARWGADMELEACCEWLKEQRWLFFEALATYLRAARRPKPKSLAEQKQAIHDEIYQLLAQISANNAGALAVAEPIRRALKRLRELEGNQ